MNIQLAPPLTFNFSISSIPILPQYPACYQATYTCFSKSELLSNQSLNLLSKYFEESASPVKYVLDNRFERNPCELDVNQLNSTITKSSNAFSSIFDKEKQEVEFNFLVKDSKIFLN